MKQHKLSSEQQQQTVSGHESRQEERQFETPDEMLRFDAARTPVPAAVAQRLAQSSAAIPAPRRSWWKRLFGQ